MSGFCAIIHHDGLPIDAGVLGLMVDAAHHRGGATIQVSLHAHLASLNHALKATAGPRPDRSLPATIVASARLDNRDELLARLGAGFATPDMDDTELILASYLRWGTDAPTNLLGDFAYVIHDPRHRRLHPARDAMAMRPLFYHHAAGCTLIASEIQQLLATGLVQPEINDAAVARYLIGEFGVPEETFYRSVHALPAGHRLEVDDRGRRVEPFWTIDPDRRERYRSNDEYADRFRELFVQAVRDRVRTTDPIGLFLSGGVDSGSIASTLGWLRERGTLGTPIHAYTWAYETLKQCDERHLSDHVVRRYALEAHDLDAEASGPLARYPEHGPHRDEPYIGAYQALLEDGLRAAAADGVRDMWSGDRGDLVSGVWSASYYALLRRGRWRDLMGELVEHAAVRDEGWVEIIGRYVMAPALRAAARRRLRHRPAAVAPRADPRGPPWLRQDLQVRTGVDPTSFHDAEPPASLRGFARRERFRLLFMPLHMRGMVWSERTNAAFGLGFVDPWSDRRLAEFVLAVPQAVLNRPGELRKRLVREAMRGIMPEKLRHGAAKIVPRPLFERALRRDQVVVIRDLLTDMEADRRGYLDGATLRKHYEEILQGGRAHVTLWWALTLEMWLRRFWR